MGEMNYGQEERDKGLLEFTNLVKRAKEQRNYKVSGSYGIYDGYKYYRKTKPKERKYVLTESQYFAITRRINNYLSEALSRGEDILFPCRLGRLELRKRVPEITIKNGKLKMGGLPIDWDKTLKLWYEDKESYKNKTLVRSEEKEIFSIYYNRGEAEYTNKSFYQFNVNRDLKKRLKQNIKEGKVDAFIFTK